MKLAVTKAKVKSYEFGGKSVFVAFNGRPVDLSRADEGGRRANTRSTPTGDVSLFVFNFAGDSTTGTKSVKLPDKRARK